MGLEHIFRTSPLDILSTSALEQRRHQLRGICLSYRGGLMTWVGFGGGFGYSMGITPERSLWSLAQFNLIVQRPIAEDAANRKSSDRET